MKKIDITDILIILGLVGIGVGLYLWVGLGPSLVTIGGLLFGIGIVSTRTDK